MSSTDGRKFALAIHAGAAESWIGDSSRSTTTCDFLNQLLHKMAIALDNGAKAIEIVTETVAVLEDYPKFNAGKGSAINDKGFHEVRAYVLESCR